MSCLITDFIKNNGKSYKQGSDTHLELRRNYIGCSELYKAIGTISMVKAIIKNKLCPQPLNILPVTHGLHFEDNCEEFLGYILNNKRIYKAPGSILNPNIPCIACSPDGLGYLNVTEFNKYKKTKKGIEYVSISHNAPNRDELLNAFRSNNTLPEILSNEIMSNEIMNNEIMSNEILNTGTYDTRTTELEEFTLDELEQLSLIECNQDSIIEEEPCLFEYKSPFSRKLKDGYISLDYEHQIQGGMQVLDICNYACFFEGVFKLCSLNQLFGTWCYDMNFSIYECLEDATEIAKGIKLYFLKEEFFNNPKIIDRLLRLLDEFNSPMCESLGVDFGIHEYFKSFFVGLNESMFRTVNLPMYQYKDDTFITNEGIILDKENVCIMLSEYAQKSGYLGYACWKLYDYQIIIQRRKNIIGNKELSRCKSIMECIQQIDDPAQIDFLHLNSENQVVL